MSESSSRLSSICEKGSMESLCSDYSSPPTLYLVKDFGWPTTSPRYRGDHTQLSNPDWEHDPMSCAKMKEEAMKKMEVSYALYMANMNNTTPAKKANATKDKDTWARIMRPWKWTVRREVSAM